MSALEKELCSPLPFLLKKKKFSGHHINEDWLWRAKNSFQKQMEIR